MDTQRQKGFEYKHLECPQSWIDGVVREHAKFYWELVGTQTVVSKESHLEDGGFLDRDTIYSVTTTERFGTVDLKRDLNRRDLDRVRSLETEYFGVCKQLVGMGCSPVSNYGPPPKKHIGIGTIVLYLLWIVPGLLRTLKIGRDNEKLMVSYQEAKGKLDGFIQHNRALLNI